jgi:hypothetical protein
MRSKRFGFGCPYSGTPASHLVRGPARWHPRVMFPHEIKEVGVSAIQVRERLVQLHAERALAEVNGLAEAEAYMADLHEEIEAIDRLYVLYAVREIAVLRGGLSGIQVG